MFYLGPPTFELISGWPGRVSGQLGRRDAPSAIVVCITGWAWSDTGRRNQSPGASRPPSDCFVLVNIGGGPPGVVKIQDGPLGL